MNLTVGVISDTHGVLPNEVFDIFEGVRAIFHCGDICDPNPALRGGGAICTTATPAPLFLWLITVSALFRRRRPARATPCS